MNPEPNLPAMSPPRQSPGRSIGTQIEKIYSELVAPLRMFDRFHDDHPEWAKEVYRAETVPVDPAHIRNEGAKQRCLERSRAFLAAVPGEAAIAKALGYLHGAADGNFDPGKTRIVTAMMIDAFPNARPHSPAVFVEALVHELKVAGHSPEVAAVACAEIRRTAKFVPAIAEVLEVCASSAETVSRRVALGCRAIEAIYAAQDTISSLEAMPELPPELPFKSAAVGARPAEPPEIEF